MCITLKYWERLLFFLGHIQRQSKIYIGCKGEIGRPRISHICNRTLRRFRKSPLSNLQSHWAYLSSPMTLGSVPPLNELHARLWIRVGLWKTMYARGLKMLTQWHLDCPQAGPGRSSAVFTGPGPDPWGPVHTQLALAQDQLGPVHKVRFRADPGPCLETIFKG